MCNLFHSCSLFIFSTSEILWLPVFKLSKCDTICLQLVLRIIVLTLNFKYDSSQQLYYKCTLDIKLLS